MSNNDATMHEESQTPPEHRVVLPMMLLLAAALSTFWVGTVDWKPISHFYLLSKGIWTAFDWPQGLVYMVVVMTVLLTHEMGHFLMALRNRIPSSFPYFIPLPIVPFGTLGAVIGMEGSRANRRELFDLGVAGPLAGLAVTIPVAWYGIRMIEPVAPVPGDMFFHNPLLLQYMISWLRPDYADPSGFHLSQFNPYLMAGWVGMLVTGLNMLPISQFDGGHVAYALLGRRQAHLLARGLLIFAILFILYNESYPWVLLLVLVILLGVDHPDTADDRAKLGWLRLIVGWAAIFIPVFCFPPWGITSH
ncbi:MAG: site-2 protease family protein [Pirellulaceae bacterium]|nr:site-2 protease family protein [Pirellulaceae bacterium]